MTNLPRKPPVGGLPEIPSTLAKKTTNDAQITARPTIDAWLVARQTSLVGVDPSWAIMMPIGAMPLDMIVTPDGKIFVWAIGYSAREPKPHPVYVLQAGEQVPEECTIDKLIGKSSIVSPRGAMIITVWKRGIWPTGLQA